ncbi:hypothetical protein V6N13_085519 [Hibiscus sabdariffa]|uniref:DUF4408 domain-containing protein n=1 Tax=Hibiscus sabdariffa TaxID=183260 RepID=A0ABR2D4M0_9ROSI
MAMKKQIKTQFSIHNSFHLLAGISFTCSLFFSDIHSLCSSMEQFLLVSLLCIWSSFSNPKCLFVVVNVIVIFLVGESGVVGSKKPPVASDVYNEYMKQSRGRVRSASASNEAKRMVEVKEVITFEFESLEEATCGNIAEENEREIVEEETFEIAEENDGSEIVEEETPEIAEEIHEGEIDEEETFEIAEEINGREIVEDEQVAELSCCGT